MRTARLLGWIGALAVAATPAAAQTTGSFKFLSGGNVAGFGVAVGTYKAQLDGKNLDIWCVDFLDHVGVGNQYTVNITGLGGSQSLSKTRFQSLSEYREAAYLASKFYTAPTSDWKYIHAAIWSITEPGFRSFNAFDQGKINTWLTDAATNYSHYSYNNVYVLSDVAIERCAIANPTKGPWIGCGHQEHIYIDGGQLTVTPEPASMALMATGLVGVGGIGWFRRRKQGPRS